MTTQQQSKQRQAKRAQPMKNVKKKPAAERWKLYRTLEASTPYTVPYSSGTTTPYADTYRQVYQLLTDELLTMSTYTTNAIKLRTQEKTANRGAGNFKAIVKLYIYIKA